MAPPAPDLDLLAIAPHPDDAELICGGTLARAARQGHRVGILDLTHGEMASRGTVALRAAEAEVAARLLGVTVRANLGLPDSGITNTPETRRALALVFRRLRPRVVIAPAPAPFGRHPDHRVAAELIRDAVFVAGLAKTDTTTPPFRPFKVLHAITFREDHQRPSFVVDITDTFDAKLAAIQAYQSQFEGATQAGEVYPNGEPLAEIIRHHCAHYGSLIRVRYGEPFVTTETMAVDDVVSLGVSTF
ncbi:MAG: bacillithiol biosynthesis deacetylase BshB1 [Gemmatimonadetes bacterium]|nr:bacillithiol biosynthesis deacetylase BshB1 [Gemmatimonadota bacterium]